MSRRFGLALMLVGLLLWSGPAQAQRGMSRYRNSPAMSPYGPVFNPTQTPEWRQAGGNPIVYEQLMMQKMAAAEQAAFQKQWAQYQQQLKKQGVTAAPTAPLPPRKAKKKKPTLKPSTTAAPGADATKGAKPAVAAKSDDDDDEVATVKPTVDPKASTASPAKPATPK